IPCSPSLRNLGTAWIVGCGALRVTALCQLLLGNQEHSTAIPRNNHSPDMIEMSGFICGWGSRVFYLGSRFPPLQKNLRGFWHLFQRSSTEGTFFLLFALAMTGNCTCGPSLVLKMPKPESSQALCFVHHLSWLVGSFGVLFLDIFVS
ncbi:LAAT1 protein, partial [Mohoua ochrocephala]|nr:LAAT1 protein [Mohoua ochrocephala]